MKTDIIFITGDFPSISGESGSEGIYFYDVARHLCEEAGMCIQVVAFRIDGKEYFEENSGLSVRRFDIPVNDGGHVGLYAGDIKLMYSHRMYDKAVSALASHAVRIAESCKKNTPAWCHGIETSGAAMEFRKRGYPVVAVAHYLMAQELMYRLESADDPFRAGHAARTISYYAGALISRRRRPALLRLLSHAAPIISRFPLPYTLEMRGSACFSPRRSPPYKCEQNMTCRGA